MELERSENILIVTHQAVLRCIYAYFMGSTQEKSPWMEVPLHTLIKLTPRAYGTVEERYSAQIPAVSTWRGKGSSAKHQDSPSMSPELSGRRMPSLNEPPTSEAIGLGLSEAVAQQSPKDLVRLIEQISGCVTY